MKPVLILPFLVVLSLNATGQILNPKEAAKRKAENRTNRGIDRTIDKGLDKVEEGIGSIFKKKDKPTKKTAEPAEEAPAQPTTPTPPPRTVEEVAEPAVEAKVTTQPSLSAYSKFDFVPGEKTIAVEDFEQDQVGDFPAKWHTNSSGEVVTFDNAPGKWLQLGPKGIYYPDFVSELPENATIEFDMIATKDYSENRSGLEFRFIALKDRTLMLDHVFNNKTQVSFDFHPHRDKKIAAINVWVYNAKNEAVLKNDAIFEHWKVGVPNRISIWKQKGRVRAYINETKVWDLPKVFEENVQYAPMFTANTFAGKLYISNLRVAVGSPDTRHKLLTEGKLVTRGITFDVASDKIKPESQGTLKEIADVLSANPTVQVRIIGHTDSDGDETSNMDLSKRRAQSVKEALQQQYGIAAERMQTDGKGESEPVEPNTTAAGKANNRRVEFIKL